MANNFSQMVGLQPLEILSSPGRTQKGYISGTHRLVSPEETLNKARPHFTAMGITRIANVTGLDRIGLPVCMVCRPNSRSLSVAQGKGLSLMGAQASGVMEAAESFHAENITLPLRTQNLSSFKPHEVVDVSRLPRSVYSVFHPELVTPWIDGFDIINGRHTYVPYELVHTDFRLETAGQEECFPMSSNGLASGNNIFEATIHALCEVIERDATMLWHIRSPEGREPTGRIDLSTIDHQDVERVIDMLTQAGLNVAVWDITSDIGVPAFYAMVLDNGKWNWPPLYSASGKGCHPARHVALLRALLEAAQSRLTAISGSRDDILWDIYDTTRRENAIERDRKMMAHSAPQQSYQSVPDVAADTFEEDFATILDGLTSNGINEAVIVNLSREDIGLSVVRAVVPGLEGPQPYPEIVLGDRAQAVLSADGQVI